MALRTIPAETPDPALATRKDTRFEAAASRSSPFRRPEQYTSVVKAAFTVP